MLLSNVSMNSSCNILLFWLVSSEKSCLDLIKMLLNFNYIIDHISAVLFNVFCAAVCQFHIEFGINYKCHQTIFALLQNIGNFSVSVFSSFALHQRRVSCQLSFLYFCAAISVFLYCEIEQTFLTSRLKFPTCDRQTLFQLWLSNY